MSYTGDNLYTDDDEAVVHNIDPPLLVQVMRTFDTGAVRSSAEGKLNYARALSPLVLERYVAYLMKHNVQADGGVRTADNWKAGIEQQSYVESGIRHVMEFWKLWDEKREVDQDTVCAILFNFMGFLYEELEGHE